MTNDTQRLQAYQAFVVGVNLAIDELHVRLEVLAESEDPNPGTRVENLDTGEFGIIIENVHLPTTGTGYVWVAWDNGQVKAQDVGALSVHL